MVVGGWLVEEEVEVGEVELLMSGTNLDGA